MNDRASAASVPSHPSVVHGESVKAIDSTRLGGDPELRQSEKSSEGIENKGVEWRRMGAKWADARGPSGLRAVEAGSGDIA